MTPAEWDAMPAPLRVYADWLAEHGLPAPTVRWVVRDENGWEINDSLIFVSSGEGSVFKTERGARLRKERAEAAHEVYCVRWFEEELSGRPVHHEIMLKRLATARVVRVYQVAVP
jgi:hypothetical protein